MRPDRAVKMIRKRRAANQGFTLIETLIAMVVLTVGIVGLAAMLANGLAYMTMSQYDYIAQQKAAEAVESIFTARDIGQATWSTICNVGSSVCTGGIFVVGAEPLCDPGTDGIVDTADDYNGTACNGNPDAILQPTGAGTINATTAVRTPLSAFNFQRTVSISAVNGIANLRQIQVTITYNAGRFPRSYTLTTSISNFS
jgi:prepilin-type N-terminal cleavage/methylation domain-containing protein